VSVSTQTTGTVCSGVVVSAPQGRSGKTIVSLALCALLRKQGLAVQPFKKGPDYIDPSWLSGAAGRGCRNLDLFFMAEEAMPGYFRRACHGADVAVVEGAMGLYDGLESGWGSTAHVARTLGLPVVLVVNTSRMTGSIAALVTGFQRFQPEVGVSAVVLNNVSGSRHERKLKAAVERHCGIPVVGSVPRDPELEVKERHLGLIPFSEAERAESVVDCIRSLVEPHLDVDGILSVARTFESASPARQPGTDGANAAAKIGVMLDRVFNFYYADNLEALGEAGAELVFIDSLADRLPRIDGLYIGGGFPEFFLPELEANAGLRKDIADAAEAGLPVYAECAGLMYLCRRIRWQGRCHEMVGAIPAEVEISRRPQGHGYAVAEVVAENPLFPVGTSVRGHEFHHSKLTAPTGLDFVYRMRRGRGVVGGMDGIVHKNVFAAYTHLHAAGAPTWAPAFVSLAAAQRKREPSVSSLAR
jgi:cobyrinic acid a,c-diamide synthase